MTADGLSDSSTVVSAVSYAFADVQKFFFEDDVTNDISQAGGAVYTQCPVFNYVDGVVTVSGMTAGKILTVVTLGGSAVASTKADNGGNARAGLSGQPARVYVVSTASGAGFKLLKK